MYIELTLNFPKTFIWTKVEVLTLALVLPDLTSQILVGTNKLDVLYSKCAHENATTFLSSMVIKQYFKFCKIMWRQACNWPLVYVKLRGISPKVVLTGSTVAMDGYVHLHGPHRDRWVTLKLPWVPLSNGLLIANCVHTLSYRCPFKLSVLLRNRS